MYCVLCTVYCVLYSSSSSSSLLSCIYMCIVMVVPWWCRGGRNILPNILASYKTVISDGTRKRERESVGKDSKRLITINQSPCSSRDQRLIIIIALSFFFLFLFVFLSVNIPSPIFLFLWRARVVNYQGVINAPF